MEWREAVSDGQTEWRKEENNWREENNCIVLIVIKLSVRINNQIVILSISPERTNSYLLEKITICLFGY